MASRVEKCNSRMDTWHPAGSEVTPGRVTLLTNYLPEGEIKRYVIFCADDNSATEIYRGDPDEIPEPVDGSQIKLNREDLELIVRLNRRGDSHILAVKERPDSRARTYAHYP